MHATPVRAGTFGTVITEGAGVASIWEATGRVVCELCEEVNAR